MLIKNREEMLRSYWKLPLLPDYIMRWATLTPDSECLVFADTGESYDYQAFNYISDLYALNLKQMGLNKGDVLVTQMFAVPEFFFLIYGCLKAGIIISPLDVKQQPEEVVRDIEKIKGRAFVCPGKTQTRDYNEVIEVVKSNCPYVEHLLQLSDSSDIHTNSEHFYQIFSDSKMSELKDDQDLLLDLKNEYEGLKPDDPALIIFTTGTTGEPKPALLSHKGIITNNKIFSRGVGLYGSDYRFLNIMPTSHVAGTAQGPMTAWFCGGSIISLSIFEPSKALQAVEDYQATFFGGVPTMFRMVWSLPDYKEYDLSSLRFSLYGGSAVDSKFLEQMADMSPTFGTALGMTETSGYFTCTPKGISIQEMVGQVGQFYPELARVTIREPMQEDGQAGKELPLGETGEICVEGDVVFLGYYNNPGATSKMISSEGILYTGDMGYLKNKGTYRALVFSGRRKFVIKPKGYLVFPDEVAEFLSGHSKVNQAQVVGVPHEVYDDGVFAFVQPNPDCNLDSSEIFEYCKGIASYKRPLHVEIWPTDKPFPMNNTGKVDAMALIDSANKIVQELRENGQWD